MTCLDPKGPKTSVGSLGEAKRTTVEGGREHK